MTKNCKECESDIMDKYADIVIKYDRAQEQIKLLTECMDTKEKLNEFYRQEIEELKERFKKRGELMCSCAKQRENYRSALEEIRGIAEYCYDPADKENDSLYSIYNKINEVLNDKEL